jgi:hypothetical protein
MNELDSNSKKTIRAYVSVDRFDRLSEKLYIALQGLPQKKHNQIIRQMIYHHLNKSIDKFVMPTISDSMPNLSLRSIRVGIPFSGRDIGFDELYNKLAKVEEQRERNVIVSTAVFDALMDLYSPKIQNNEANVVENLTQIDIIKNQSVNSEVIPKKGTKSNFGSQKSEV